jgi:hypothetical protein
MLTGLSVARCRVLLLLLLLLLLFLLGHMVADSATGGRAYYGVVAGDMSGDRSDGGSLDAAFSCDIGRSREQCDA